MSTKIKSILEDYVIIPENVSVDLSNKKIKVSGPVGNNEANLFHPMISFDKKENKIILKSVKQTKNEKKILKSFKAHLNNLILGVSKLYTYKLKICSGHFPMSVSLSNNKVIIKNFFAEKVPREAKILQHVNVKLDNDILTVTGTNKELVGQTAANIEQACRLTNKDRRVFMDGIYIISKGEE